MPPTTHNLSCAPILILSLLVYTGIEDNKLFGKHNAESRYLSPTLKIFWTWGWGSPPSTQFRL